jgi:hypothetical protein
VDDGRAGVGAANDARAEILGCQVRERRAVVVFLGSQDGDSTQRSCLEGGAATGRFYEGRVRGGLLELSVFDRSVQEIDC